MAKPLGSDALRLLKAFSEIEEAQVRELIISLAEAAAAGAELKVQKGSAVDGQLLH